MGKGDNLGDLEHLVLWSIVRLGAKAYGAAIWQELKDRADRDVAMGAIHTTLERLERKGFARSRFGDPTPERGGRAKRLFLVTGAGAKALERQREVLTGMWRGLSPAAGRA